MEPICRFRLFPMLVACIRLCLHVIEVLGDDLLCASDAAELTLESTTFGYATRHAFISQDSATRQVRGFVDFLCMLCVTAALVVGLVLAGFERCCIEKERPGIYGSKYDLPLLFLLQGPHISLCWTIG